MIRPSNRPKRKDAPADAEARAEDLYQRMRASVEKMREVKFDHTAEDGYDLEYLRDIRELLLHLVELVVL